MGQMQGEAAGFADELSGQGEEAPPEGLGGHHLLKRRRKQGIAKGAAALTLSPTPDWLTDNAPTVMWSLPPPQHRHGESAGLHLGNRR